MIGLLNRDSSYFSATIGKVSEAMQSMTKNVISFSITEEMGKLLTGTLSVYDPEFYYTDILRMGRTVQLEWGYKKFPMFFPMGTTVDQVAGTFKRTGVKGIIQSPSGGGTERGVKTYNCNFIGTEYRAGIFHKTYTIGTKATVVMEVLTALGVLPVNQYVLFKRGVEKLTPDTYVMQHESHVRFLNRLSFEWGAIFEVSTNSLGMKIALFANIDTPAYKTYVKFKCQVLMGSSMVFNYLSRETESSTLVRSFTWSQNGGTSGDNVQIMIVNGQPMFMRYNAATEKTIVYKLRPERMRAVLNSKPDFSSKVGVVKDWLGATSFEALLRDGYFTQSTETTAPQGIGFTINLKTLGNPMIATPMRARFEASLDGTEHFPDVFKSAQLRFWVRKVTHTIDTNGYHCDVEVVDSFTISGGSLVG